MAGIVEDQDKTEVFVPPAVLHEAKWYQPNQNIHMKKNMRFFVNGGSESRQGE
jgi:hypothetical protein